VCVLSCQRLQLVVARHYTYSVVKDLFCSCILRCRASNDRKQPFLFKSSAFCLSPCTTWMSVPLRKWQPLYPILQFPHTVVGLGRLELPTSPLSGVRSNHLSYRPPQRRGVAAVWWSWSGSNRRPPECKSGALPAELQPLSLVACEPKKFRG
jgi:hypothetical protein